MKITKHNCSIYVNIYLKKIASNIERKSSNGNSFLCCYYCLLFPLKIDQHQKLNLNKKSYTKPSLKGVTGNVW